VFATQNLLKTALKEVKGIDVEDRQDIKVNVIGVNHFTWLTSAQYKNVDIFEVYKEFVKKYKDTGFENSNDDNWANKYFYTTQMVKFDLFHRYGYIAAAGDRHLAEFCPGSWYLNSPKTVDDYKFALTGIDYRWRNLEERLQKSKDLVEGKEELKLMVTGEDGVDQIRALLGLHDMITNVNIPNMGQIPNLPLGAVVETNAIFRSDSVQPVLAGPIPKELYSLISRICGEQEALDEAIAERDLDKVFNVFANDPQIKLTLPDARKLFDEMVENTKEYLKDYFN
jgi:alpha-galactosidase